MLVFCLRPSCPRELRQRQEKSALVPGGKNAGRKAEACKTEVRHSDVIATRFFYEIHAELTKQ